MDPDPGAPYRSLLQSATRRFRECLRDAPAGSGETPYLDALVLLGHAASLTTERLFAALTDPVPAKVAAEFARLVDLRCSGTPVSYIRGRKEFYGREFSVGPGVLVPRPETELLVEAILDTARERVTDGSSTTDRLHIHDCCTGSGCVAITVACELSCAMTAADVSGTALEYAQANATALCQPVEFWQGDLLSPLRSRLDSGEISRPTIVSANPPYLADNEVEQLRRRGWPEPTLALAAGEDGLALIRRLAEEAAACLPDGGWLIAEIGAEQGATTAGIFERAGFREVEIIRDLARRDRVCRGQWYRP